MKKKIIYTILILGMLGTGIGYYMFNKPLESIESMKTDYKMSSNDLLLAFENDESASNQKYLDKVIEVIGKVIKTETVNGTTSVYLATENDLSSVIFQLEKADTSIVAGKEITIKGICTGYLMDVILVRSKIV